MTKPFGKPLQSMLCNLIDLCYTNKHIENKQNRTLSVLSNNLIKMNLVSGKLTTEMWATSRKY